MKHFFINEFSQHNIWRFKNALQSTVSFLISHFSFFISHFSSRQPHQKNEKNILKLWKTNKKIYWKFWIWIIANNPELFLFKFLKIWYLKKKELWHWAGVMLLTGTTNDPCTLLQRFQRSEIRDQRSELSAEHWTSTLKQ